MEYFYLSTRGRIHEVEAWPMPDPLLPNRTQWVYKRPNERTPTGSPVWVVTHGAELFKDRALAIAHARQYIMREREILTRNEEMLAKLEQEAA